MLCFTPELAPVVLAVIGLVVTTLLVVKNARGAIIFGILGTTIIGILMGVVDLSAIDWHGNSLGSSISELGITFGAAFLVRERLRSVEKRYC